MKGQLVPASVACVVFSGKYHYCSGCPEIWPEGYSPDGDIGGWVVRLDIAVQPRVVSGGGAGVMMGMMA